ncbi:hypothetical protein GQ53DRAFT_864106 [Thozetella sp. PMI_491]|nr:hypothetical protein GQ53DRAFT_864106 [Thozetella sp. PMI_491]
MPEHTTFPTTEVRPERQLRRLMLAGVAQWLVTTVIIACLYSTLAWFSSQDVLSPTEKRVFNTLITAFSIALGLSVVSSLKAMALQLRWLVLSWQLWTVQELDLIFHASSLTHLLKLGVISEHPAIRYASLFWILLKAVAQIGVATLGLTYSIDTADRVALFVDGLVAVPNMTTLPTNGVVSSSTREFSALEYIANNFGILALALGASTVDDIPAPGTIASEKNPNLMFSTGDSWQYIFYETNADPFLPGGGGVSPISIATDRSVNSTAVCRSWPVVQGGNGTGLSIAINTSSENTPSVIAIPLAGGLDQTTFLTRDDGSTSCGPGCSRVMAFEASISSPWYYDCNVTVGDVVNATRSEHEIGPIVKTLAAGAIALQGFGSSSLAEDPAVQYQSYPAESAYGIPRGGDNLNMAMMMARFAIGVIAFTASSSPIIVLQGKSPQQGVTLNVTEWRNAHIIFSLTAGLQLILALSAAIIANRVIVRDDSPLATARVFRPIVNWLDQPGCTGRWRDKAEIMGTELKVVYHAEKPEDPECFYVQFPKG